jgi:hypothetical protein
LSTKPFGLLDERALDFGLPDDRLLDLLDELALALFDELAFALRDEFAFLAFWGFAARPLPLLDAPALGLARGRVAFLAPPDLCPGDADLV